MRPRTITGWTYKPHFTILLPTIMLRMGTWDIPACAWFAEKFHCSGTCIPKGHYLILEERSSNLEEIAQIQEQCIIKRALFGMELFWHYPWEECLWWDRGYSKTAHSKSELTTAHGRTDPDTIGHVLIVKKKSLELCSSMLKPAILKLPTKI